MNQAQHARSAAPASAAPQPRSGGFTLTELLIVMLIIVVLMSLLIPVISKVRNAAYQAATQQQINRIAAAIQQYYSDTGYYPGIFKNDDIGTTNMLAINTPAGAQITNISNATHITETESMYLSLCGGLIWTTTGGALDFDLPTFKAGKGAVNMASSANPKLYPSYLVPGANDLLSTDVTGSMSATSGVWNRTFPNSAGGYDSEVPEFGDQFPSYPMPIVYLRAKPGNLLTCDGAVPPTLSAGQYNYNHLVPYFSLPNMPTIKIPTNGGTSGSTLANAPNVNPTGLPVGSSYPGNLSASDRWVLYFGNPLYYPTTISSANQITSNNNTIIPKEKDGFWLISAGQDRQYGTADDICYGFQF